MALEAKTGFHTELSALSSSEVNCLVVSFSPVLQNTAACGDEARRVGCTWLFYGTPIIR
jgi:hypothetical protein